jgi:thiol-disulfide isomerase/thioredoxin
VHDLTPARVCISTERHGEACSDVNKRFVPTGVVFWFIAAAAVAQSPGQQAPPWSIEHWLVTDGQAQPGELPVQPRAGRVTLVDFWATWCLPCIAAMDEVSSLQERGRDRGLDVVAVTDEPLPTVIAFLRRSSPDGGPWWNRFRTALATDPDGSTLATLVPAEFRSYRPFAVVIGKTGAIEWMGSGADAKPVIAAVLEDRWDRESFVLAWQKQIAEQRERERIQAEEDWAAARSRHWSDANLLGKIAFRIAFDFGSRLKNRDLAVGEAFAERAVELTASKSAYEIAVLAQMRHVRMRHADAVILARQALSLVPAGEDISFYRDNLATYAAAAGAK